MRSAYLKAAPLALMFLYAATVARAGVDLRTVSETNGQIVVQIDSHHIPNFSPLVRFYVAVAPTGTYSAHFFAGPAPGASSPSLRAGAAIDTVTVSAVFDFRGSRVIWLKVQVPADILVSHVVVDYTPAATVASAATADPLVKTLVENQSLFPTQTTPGAPQAWFSLAGGWAKCSVTQRGVYSVTGSDLSAAGINLDSIDPATLRMYTQGGLDQPRELVDAAGSWRPGAAMREVAVRVEAGTDGTFDPGDRVIFYGIGARDWANYYESAEPDTVFHEHTRARTNFYYLGWGGALPGTPLHMADVDATPSGVPDRTTYTHREYRENDLVSDFDYRGDGWLWLDIGAPGAGRYYGLDRVDVRDVVSSVPQEFLSIALAPYNTTDTTATANKRHHAVFRDRRNGATVFVGEKVWDTKPGERHYENGLPIRVGGSFLQNGPNDFLLEVPGDLNPRDKMLFAWYSVRYERRIVAVNDATLFSTPDTTGALNLRARGFSTSGTMYAFDVTDPWNPSRLTGTDVTTAGPERVLRLGADLTGSRRHYWAGTGAGFAKPAVARLSPVELRADPSPPNMLIITHRELRSAAEQLRTYRAAGRVPFYDSPVVKVVTTDEVYDNFSGGMPDAMAIRNYLKYLFDNFKDAHGNPRIGYVLLLGDATEDFQNHVSAQPDFVPSNLYFTNSTEFTYSTDEWFGQLEVSDQTPGHGTLDVALGRLPAASADEASFLVNKIIAYENDAPREDWRHRIILLADDEISSFELSCERDWTLQSENIAANLAPDFTSIQKIYLTEYPEIAGVKPTSRFAFLDAWNAGALVINYIGHGSSVQMADEQVFLGADVSQLVNGLKLPLLMAFSCTIGDFANSAGKSLSEKLLLREEGGSIAAITASRESYPEPNLRICNSLFGELFPNRLGRPQLPAGIALMHAKLFGQVDTNWQVFQEENTWKYNLLGDPAMRLAIPQQEIKFAVAPAETLVAGLRHSLSGAIYQGNSVDAGFNGPVKVTVREPNIQRAYKTRCGNFTIDYDLPGGPIYIGTVDAVDGRFSVNFRVPRYAATGTLAYAGAYGREGDHDAAASVDSVLVVAPPTLADSLALKPVDGSPRVDLGFKSGLKVVKPGDTVRARVLDGDGINILNTTNEGRQAILIDKLPVPIDVNEFFSFDHGGTDTSGVLLYPLPELHVGRHQLVYKVSDSFGFTTLDTLQFDVTDAANYYAQAAFNYPNPFTDSTRFLFRVSNRASIKLELYTVSGKFVRRIEQVRDGGEVWVEWDGRDNSGGDVANGSYLYVATFDFVGVDRPPVVVRGKLTRVR